MTEKFLYQVLLQDKEQPDGRKQVIIKAIQENNSVTFNTNIFIEPENFSNGLIINHPLADKYNMFIYKKKNDIEATELDILAKRGKVTPVMLHYIINDKISPSAKIKDFTKAVMDKSDRQSATINGYESLVKDIISYTGEDTCIEDMSYDWLVGFQKFLQNKGLAKNTIIGKFKFTRALINEAIRRRLISKDDDPFMSFRIPQMACKRGYLDYEDLNKLAELELTKKREKRIRDAFLFACYTGLRYSDMKTLTEAKFKDGWFYKTMYKTKFDVSVPYALIFNGKAVDIIKKYEGNIKELSRIGVNSSLNRTLKEIVKKAGINKKVTFHMSRHTCATLLLREGIPVTTVMYLLGHQKIETTMIYAEITEKTVLNDLKKAFTETTETLNPGELEKLKMKSRSSKKEEGEGKA